METKKKALGRGLEQLFSNERIDFDTFESEIINNSSESDIQDILISEIRVNPYQPRKVFEANALKELSESIKEHGVIQPIIVKKSIKGYEIIAGERRTRAAKMAGLERIPAIVRDYNDNEMMEIALVENIQRENLNPLEEAIAYHAIIQATGMTQETIADKFSKSRSHITNMLGLLRLPKPVQKQIMAGEITMGHARVLSKLSDDNKIIELTNKIINEQLSVRDIESYVQNENVPKKIPMTKTYVPNIKHNIYENIMREKIGTKVKITNKKIEIPYDSEKDLERILEILEIEIRED